MTDELFVDLEFSIARVYILFEYCMCIKEKIYHKVHLILKGELFLLISNALYNIFSLLYTRNIQIGHRRMQYWIQGQQIFARDVLRERERDDTVLSQHIFWLSRHSLFFISFHSGSEAQGKSNHAIAYMTSVTDGSRWTMFPSQNSKNESERGTRCGI